MGRYTINPNRDYSKYCKKIRESYGHTVATMGRLMGFGANQWRNYEKGQQPSASNALLIELIADPEIWLKVLKIRTQNVDSSIEEKQEGALSDPVINEIIESEEFNGVIKDAIISGLKKIREHIGDRDFDDYMEEKKDEARKRLFGDKESN